MRCTAIVVRGICIRDRIPSCMRAPPEAANRMKGVFFSTARSMPAITASPAAMPSEPAMKRKSCAAATIVEAHRACPRRRGSRHRGWWWPWRRAAGRCSGGRRGISADRAGRPEPGLARTRRCRTDCASRRSAAHAHVDSSNRDDELVGLEVLVEDHLPGLRAFHPQIVRHLALRRQEAADLGTDDVIDPVHAFWPLTQLGRLLQRRLPVASQWSRPRVAYRTAADPLIWRFPASQQCMPCGRAALHGTSGGPQGSGQGLHQI